MRVTFNVYNMTCAVCQKHISTAVKKVPGVRVCNVSLMTNSMTVDYDEKITNDDIIIKAVVDAGYNAKRKSHIMESTKKEMKINKGLSISSFLCSLIIWAIVIYLKRTNVTDKITLNLILPILIILSTTVVCINIHYFKTGYKAIFKGRPTMNSLIALSCTASYAYSMFNTILILYYLNIKGSGYIGLKSNICFESTVMILTIVTIGKYIESRIKNKTTINIDKLVKLIPEYAICIQDGKEVSIKVDDIKINDEILVNTGMRAPVDGIVIRGEATVDNSIMTGESLPVYVVPGSKIIASGHSISGSYVMRATSTGENSSMKKIVNLVKEASESKAPISRIADIIGNFFVPIVFALSVITFVVWWFQIFDFNKALQYAVSVLVVSCPCAIGLATPSAIMVSVGIFSKEGILVKNAEAIEMASNIDTVVLDKTGTVTLGKPKVIGVLENGYTERDIMTIAYSLEKGMAHPLSNAINEYSEKRDIVAKEVTNYEYIQGQGIKGTIDGHNYYFGNPKTIQFSRTTPLLERKMEEWESRGVITVVLFDGNASVGVVGIQDVIKKSSIQAIKELKNMNIDVILATGDNARTANAIGYRVGIAEVYSEVMPNDKKKLIEKLQQNKKKVAMIGDGINDSIALAQSDLGIAIGAGSDVAVDYADIVLQRSDLIDAVNCFRLAKKTVNTIKINFAWAIFYNGLMIPMACGLSNTFNIVMNPITSAFSMLFSSVLVMLIALTINNFQPIKYDEEKNSENTNDELNKEIKVSKEIHMDSIVKVDGMMCSHCSARVKEAIEKVPNVTNVEVDLATKEVIISSVNGVDNELVKKAVTDIGYKFIG